MASSRLKGNVIPITGGTTGCTKMIPGAEGGLASHLVQDFTYQFYWCYISCRTPCPLCGRGRCWLNVEGNWGRGLLKAESMVMSKTSSLPNIDKLSTHWYDDQRCWHGHRLGRSPKVVLDPSLKVPADSPMYSSSQSS